VRDGSSKDVGPGWFRREKEASQAVRTYHVQKSYIFKVQYKNEYPFNERIHYPISYCVCVLSMMTSTMESEKYI